MAAAHERDQDRIRDRDAEGEEGRDYVNCLGDEVGRDRERHVSSGTCALRRLCTH
jgi:hypothetical protein